MSRSAPVLFALAAATAALGGCYESPDVTNFDPGVYKGKEDPLMETTRSAEFQEQLRERFATVQTDR